MKRERSRQEGEEQGRIGGNGKCAGMTPPDDSYSCLVTMGNGRMMLWVFCVFALHLAMGLHHQYITSRSPFHPDGVISKSDPDTEGYQSVN